MAYRSPPRTKPRDERAEPQQLSQNGHLLGVAVYGGLVLLGFMFGIVTGYERPKTVTVAKAEKDRPKREGATTASPKTGPEGGSGGDTPAAGTATPKGGSGGTDGGSGDPPTPGGAGDITTPPGGMPPDTPPKNNTPAKIDTPPTTGGATPPKKKEPPKVATRPVSFQREVLPILRSYCLNCHGAAGKAKGDVDLRTVASIKRGGGGPILEIGKPEKSAIYTQIVDGAMPPNGKKPGKGELEVIRNWILTGAKERRRTVRTRRPGRR